MKMLSKLVFVAAAGLAATLMRPHSFTRARR